ncbi:MAG: nicotinamide-nucleotide amidohydrolase family protein [Myxococcales bacterium]|nr:nicotinamide-nucleotide amidohydrolase family protein [Myxococcales bacterium]MCB9525046.1 nicotinamide-nucleotide amidohydrolase family protein [Myxococcales bacterium]
MIIEGLSIGDELLDGRVVDSNAARIDHALRALGHRTGRRVVVPDDPAQIATAVAAAAARCELCVVTGGLGPTSDDVTAQAVAQAAGVPLLEDAHALEHLTTRLAGRPLTPARRKQAAIPQGAQALLNPVGTAPGFLVRIGGCQVLVLPGVPREVAGFLERDLARLVPPADQATTVRLRFALVGESALAAAVESHALEGVTVGYRAQGPETEISFRGPSDAVRAAAHLARAAFPDACLPDGLNLAQATLAAARAAGATLATAESCTGGLVGGALTAIPGSSDVVFGGIIAYSNTVKSAVLGVPSATLEAHGAVSEPVARAMAQGARQATTATAAVAITGIAGPGGGTADKPVGTVWFAWRGPDFDDTERHQLAGDRDQVRRYAVAHALDGLRRRMTRP